MSEDNNADKFIKETSILEEYNINWTQKLGAGISGPVRVCVKKSTQERLALKILIDRPKARNEVRLHMMCATHPNIVQIMEVYANSVQFPHESIPRARLLIVMEMMEGGELFHRISQHRHFTEKMASQVTKQIGQALEYCHSLNIAHRDLKPENLLFKDNSLDAPVKLCDFGFAKIDQGDLMTPQFTPYYVAPQVLEAQRRHQKEKSGIIPTSPTPYTYNKSCDLWSMGVIIYVMLCGYPPFYSKHHSRTIPKDMRKKIMTASFDFPEDEWSQISEMAKDIVRKLLKVKPEERLTIEGVLEHPWLNCTEALDNVLPSAQMMMDKAMVAGIQQAHAEQLANMRIQDLNISLKPLNSVNNPILRKRKLLGSKQRDGFFIHDPENGSEDANVALEKLRDVIAQCILPQAGPLSLMCGGEVVFYSADRDKRFRNPFCIKKMPMALSDVWRHFTAANVEGKAVYICKYCTKSYVKNATRMQNHLAKCIKFPQHSQQATSDKSPSTSNRGENDESDTL
ncbi:MAP kinase-activated protein kinase 5-like isoform X1 [Oncorhynchus clarkii lewisi]|uniref:MAP kinase-activated protein kinase 5-like isoform X1 n=1 Tax=Oncorhynchus clarkii lewisi TaxID=490388 RepID=UPI0039B97CB5